MIEVLILIITVVIILSIILITYKNKFSFAILKIDEAENNIDILLLKKLDL